MAHGDKLVTLDGLKSVYQIVNGEVSGLKSAVEDFTEIKQSANFTDPAQSYGATIDNDTGAIVTPNSYYRCSAHIPCESGETIYIYYKYNGNFALRKSANDKVAFYKANDDFISIGYNENSYTVPAEAAYLVQQGYNALMRDGECGIFKEQHTNTETWIPFSHETIIVTDKNLTMPNVPADAKAVGDSIAPLNGTLETIMETVIISEGNDLVPSWIHGDLDADGVETPSSSYYITPPISVNAGGKYLLEVVTPNAEGTIVASPWTNTSYCVVHCYAENESHLGTATNSNGFVTTLANTAYIRIGHSLINTLQMYDADDFTYAEEITPGGYEDITVKAFDTDVIQDGAIGISKCGFLGRSSLCILDKDSCAPWFVCNSRFLASSVIQIDPGDYYLHVQFANLSGTTIYVYNAANESIATRRLGNYQTPIKFNLPANTHHIRIVLIATQNNPLLSEITRFRVYGAAAATMGYDDISKVINASVLPALPPLAFTGQAGGEIMSLGHGGLSSVYAEDSIESFYALARCGYAGTEVDIQFTKDHIPVCWHNPSLSTLAGATSNDHIYDYTLAELDANFDFSSWWDTRGCFRKTVARFEEVCILARAYGWYIEPDKLTSAEGAGETDMAVLINMLEKYELGDKLLIQYGFTALREAFPDSKYILSAQENMVDDAWCNSLLRAISDHCYTDGDGNTVVNQDYTVYTGFNWATIKQSNGIEGCKETTDLMTKHNIKTIWYTIETPEDIYQLVQYCPKTAIVLTGRYTIPDGVNEYIGIAWGNNKYDLNPTIHV